MPMIDVQACALWVRLDQSFQCQEPLYSRGGEVSNTISRRYSVVEYRDGTSSRGVVGCLLQSWISKRDTEWLWFTVYSRHDAGGVSIKQIDTVHSPTDFVNEWTESWRACWRRCTRSVLKTGTGIFLSYRSHSEKCHKPAPTIRTPIRKDCSWTDGSS